MTKRMKFAAIGAGLILLAIALTLVLDGRLTNAVESVFATSHRSAAPSLNETREEFCGRHIVLTPTRKILEVLARTDLEKDEYETSSAYEQRMARIFGPLGRITIASRLWEYDSTYDADKRVLSVNAPFAKRPSYRIGTVAPSASDSLIV